MASNAEHYASIDVGQAAGFIGQATKRLSDAARHQGYGELNACADELGRAAATLETAIGRLRHAATLLRNEASERLERGEG